MHNQNMIKNVNAQCFNIQTIVWLHSKVLENSRQQTIISQDTKSSAFFFFKGNNTNSCRCNQRKIFLVDCSNDRCEDAVEMGRINLTDILFFCLKCNRLNTTASNIHSDYTSWCLLSQMYEQNWLKQKYQLTCSKKRKEWRENLTNLHLSNNQLSNFVK